VNCVVEEPKQNLLSNYISKGFTIVKGALKLYTEFRKIMSPGLSVCLIWTGGRSPHMSYFKFCWSFFCRTATRCSFCVLSFNSDVELRSHQIDSHKEKMYPCPISNCDEYLGTKAYLKSHLRRVHQTSEPRKKEYTKCSICGLLVRDPSRHERVHANIRPYVCDKCGYGAVSEFILSQHQTRCKGKFQKKQVETNYQTIKRTAAIWKRVEEFHKKRQLLGTQNNTGSAAQDGLPG